MNFWPRIIERKGLKVDLRLTFLLPQGCLPCFGRALGQRACYSYHRKLIITIRMGVNRFRNDFSFILITGRDALVSFRMDHHLVWITRTSRNWENSLLHRVDFEGRKSLDKVYHTWALNLLVRFLGGVSSTSGELAGLL